MKKISKLKLVALIMGSMAVSGAVANAQSTKKSDQERLKKEITTMSVEQIEAAIKECDIALESLKEKLAAPEKIAEEHFDARNAYNRITKGRAMLVARLDELKKQQAKTIDIRDVARTR